jgi:hypothetical protein
MSNILQFIRSETAFDPETLSVLGTVYDRACTGYCTGPSDLACEGMAARIITAAMQGERDADKLLQIALRGIGLPR